MLIGGDSMEQGGDGCGASEAVAAGATFLSGLGRFGCALSEEVEARFFTAALARTASRAAMRAAAAAAACSSGAAPASAARRAAL